MSGGQRGSMRTVVGKYTIREVNEELELFYLRSLLAH